MCSNDPKQRPIDRFLGRKDDDPPAVITPFFLLSLLNIWFGSRNNTRILTNIFVNDYASHGMIPWIMTAPFEILWCFTHGTTSIDPSHHITSLHSLVLPQSQHQSIIPHSLFKTRRETKNRKCYNTLLRRRIFHDFERTGSFRKLDQSIHQSVHPSINQKSIREE